MTTPAPDPLALVTRAEAAKLLRVSQNHVVKLERDGLFPAVRLGRRVRYRRSDLETAVERLATKR
jgi:excisionase family DNA binding protein